MNMRGRHAEVVMWRSVVVEVRRCSGAAVVVVLHRLRCRCRVHARVRAM
jgi:hypothetical protein